MTEKEKAAAGYLYNANYDEEILNEISRCNDLCHKFNQIKPSDREAQGEILKQVFYFFNCFCFSNFCPTILYMINFHK